MLSRSCTSAVGRGARLLSAKGPSEHATFSRQDELPRLPVPALDQTLDKFIEWTKPITDESIHSETKRIVEDFRSGPGPSLQRALQARAANPEVENWLDDWWTEVYLQCRDAVPVNINYMIGLDKQLMNFTEGSTNIEMAASVTHGILCYKEELDKGVLPPTLQGKEPLCMSPLTKMFGTSRVPQEGEDRLFQEPRSCHITVFCRGAAYAVTVADKATGQKYSREYIQQCLQKIWDAEPSEAEAAGLGRLGALDRDSFAEAYAALRQDRSNRESMTRLESGLFAICLDSDSPSGDNEKVRSYLHGDPRNRWYDKNISCIISADGKSIGFNNEHSWADGHPFVILSNWLVRWLSWPSELSASQEQGLPAIEASVQSLPFNTSSPAVQEGFRKAEVAIKDLLLGTEATFVKLDQYGSSLCKERKVSPDAVAQAVFHSAAYRALGKINNAYESVMTRGFALGRTEAGRPVSAEMAAFCSTLGKVTPDQSRELLAAVSKSHGVRMTECRLGNGIDRHLYGLSKMLPNGETHELFNCAAMKILKTDILSTSTLTGPGIECLGFGPVAAEGFGIGYFNKPEELRLICSAKNTNPHYSAMLEHLEGSHTDMKAVLLS